MEKKQNKEANEELKEGRDYYIERGYWVFTEYFLLNRGYCCGSGCRHCPYRKPAKKGPDQQVKP